MSPRNVVPVSPTTPQGSGHLALRAAGAWGAVKPPSTQGLGGGVSSGTKAPFRPLKPLPQPRLRGEGSGRLEECHCSPVPVGPKAHLPTVPNRDEGTGGMEGPSATCQQVGSVVGLQHPHEVGTLRLVGREEGAEGLLTISSGPKAGPCLADQPWGTVLTFFFLLNPHRRIFSH